MGPRCAVLHTWSAESSLEREGGGKTYSFYYANADSAPLPELARRHPGLYIVVQLDTLIAETSQAGVSFYCSLDNHEKLRERVLSKVDKPYVSPAHMAQSWNWHRTQ